MFETKEMSTKGRSTNEDNTDNLTWKTLQPQNPEERLKQKEICEKEGHEADYCFWGGYPDYPVCARQTCHIVPQGREAAVNMAKRRQNSENEEVAQRARKVLAG